MVKVAFYYSSGIKLETTKRVRFSVRIFKKMFEIRPSRPKTAKKMKKCPRKRYKISNYLSYTFFEFFELSWLKFFASIGKLAITSRFQNRSRIFISHNSNHSFYPFAQARFLEHYPRRTFLNMKLLNAILLIFQRTCKNDILRV